MTHESRPEAAIEVAGEPTSKVPETAPQLPQSAPLEAALLWASRGVPVFPVAIRPKAGRGTDKRPLTVRGHHDASTTGTDIVKMFTHLPMRLIDDEVLGVGALPGAAGFVVVDLDMPNDKRGSGLVKADALGLPTATFTASTGSGGEHRWFRKRDRGTSVSNTSPWADDGIDIRADAGWVVVDTVTPWGTWNEHPRSTRWDTVAAMPETMWEALTKGTTTSSGSTVSTAGWRRFDADTHLPLLHPSIPELIEVLRGEGAQVLAFRTREGGEPYLDITCDGRNPSASLGYVSPTTLNVFSASWPGRPSGPQDVITLGELVLDGHGLEGGEATPRPTARKVTLTAASTITPRRVRWTWEGRLAMGTIGLLSGPEGLGKSTLAYWIAARVTRGQLPGEHLGTPRGVLIAAAEDSWEHTIVPRLMAADADLERIFRVEVTAPDDIHLNLTLPKDIDGLLSASRTADAAMLILDPLTSRVDERLDTHRDAETRRALEPLARFADDSHLAVLGLIHHNKSGATDPLALVMGSKAFTAVARSVHTVIRDPDDETDKARLFGTPKNNLGSTDLPVLRFVIEGHAIQTDDGTAITGRLEWCGESAGTIGDAVRRGSESTDERSATADATEWLTEYLFTQGGRAKVADIKRSGSGAGHSYDSLKRAKRRLGIDHGKVGFAGDGYWMQKDVQSEQPPPQSEQPSQSTVRGESLTALIDTCVLPLDQAEQPEQPEQRGETCAVCTWALGSEGHADKCGAVA